LAGAYNSNSHARGLHYLTFVCRNKAGKINAKGASRFKEKCLRKAQRYQSSLKEQKSLCKLNSQTLAAKKPQPLCEILIGNGIG
jgi:hypothetical protein